MGLLCSELYFYLPIKCQFCPAPVPSPQLPLPSSFSLVLSSLWGMDSLLGVWEIEAEPNAHCSSATY